MKKTVAVVGSANMDIVMRVAKAPDEGETIVIGSQSFVPGGKGANRAVALARLGAQPLFSCCIGDDGFGEQLSELYTREGISDEMISCVEGIPTGMAYIFVEDSGKNRIAIYSGANGSFGASNIDSVVGAFNRISMLSLEMEIAPACVERLNYEAVRSGIPCVIDAGPIREVDPSIFKGAFILSPNESEAQALTGISIDSAESAREACRALHSYGVKYSLIKLGSRGAICFDGSEFIELPICDVGKAIDTTAAGDCFMAALCAALDRKESMRDAMIYATAAAGISVTRRGAIPSLPYAQEVEKCCGEWRRTKLD